MSSAPHPDTIRQPFKPPYSTPDAGGDDGPVGAPGPNGDPEGRGEDEGKGDDAAEKRPDASGHQRGVQGHGSQEQRSPPEPQSPH
jgi:hypothetical protein